MADETQQKLPQDPSASPADILAGGHLIDVSQQQKKEKVGFVTDKAPEREDVSAESPIRVREDHIDRRSERIYVRLDGTAGATAANYGVVFMALIPCFVRAVYEFHTTKGTDASAVTLNIEKLTGTQAPDAGSTILSTDLSLKGNINTQQKGVLVVSRVTRTLAKGDRLCLKDSGTLTAVAGVLVVIEVEYINP